MFPIPKKGSDDIPAWRQWVLLLLFFLFPLFGHPWWLAIICIVLYAGLLMLVIGRPKKPKSTA
jgi:chromate transport protein ChrA